MRKAIPSNNVIMFTRSLTVCSYDGEPVVLDVQMDKTSCRRDEVYPGKVMDKQSLEEKRPSFMCSLLRGYMDMTVFYICISQNFLALKCGEFCDLL